MSDDGKLVRLETAERGPGARYFKLEPFDAIGPSAEGEWLVDKIIPAHGLTVPYGEPGSGKSFLATYIGLCVAQSAPCGGRAVKGGTVVYVGAEGASGLRKRLAAYREHHGIGDVVPFYMVADCPDLGSRPGDAGALIASIRDQTDADVVAVIIDTLARTMLGADENNAAEMGIFIENCSRISNELNCACIVVHHAGKDGTKGARGSSVLKAAADAEIFVAGDEYRRTATLTKSKDEESGLEFAFRLDRFEFEAHGRTVASCILEPLSDWTKGDGGKAHKRTVTGAAAVALKALKMAIDEAGEAPPNTEHVPNIRGCSASLWRRYCERLEISDPNKPDAKRMAFKRAVEKLQAAEIIGVWNEWVWLCD